MRVPLFLTPEESDALRRLIAQAMQSSTVLEESDEETTLAERIKRLEAKVVSQAALIEALTLQIAMFSPSAQSVAPSLQPKAVADVVAAKSYDGLARKQFNAAVPFIKIGGQITKFTLPQLISAFLVFKRCQDEDVVRYLIAFKEAPNTNVFADTNKEAFGELMVMNLFWNDIRRDDKVHDLFVSLLELNEGIWTLRMDIVEVQWSQVGSYAAVTVLELLRELSALKRDGNWRFRKVSSYCLHPRDDDDIKEQFGWFDAHDMALLIRLMEQQYADLACCLLNWDAGLHESPKLIYDYAIHSYDPM